jgi:hypothetical protein
VDGHSVYIRYRNGVLTVSIGNSIDEAITKNYGNYLARTCGDSLDGYMSDERMKQLVNIELQMGV